MPRRSAVVRLALVASAVVSFSAAAAPPTAEEILALCANAEGPAHCGRLIEGTQLKRLPNLAVRDGPTLRVRLYPTGELKFTDVDTLSGGESTSLFDYLNEINAIVLWTTKDESLGFLLVQRTTGRQTPIPSQPAASPGRTQFATADFCPKRCENQLVVWRVTPEGARRELSWKPDPPWTDAEVRWKDTDTLVIDYTAAGNETPRKMERRLADPGWTRSDIR